MFIFYTTITGCDVPDGLDVPTIDNTSAIISWNDVNPGEDYEVEYRTLSPTGAIQTIIVSSTNSTSITGLLPGQLYSFRVKGVCNLNGTEVTTTDSGWFNFTATIIGCNMPDALEAPVIDNTSATLTWNDVNPGEDYEVEYRTLSPTGAIQTIIVSSTNSTSITGLLPGQLYSFRVKGVCNLDGTEVTTTDSGWFNFTTTTCGIPGGLGTATQDNTSATVFWNDVNPGEDYLVEYRLNFAGSSYFPGISVSGVNSVDITELNPSTAYLFRVHGVCNATGELVNSVSSSEVLFATTDANAPSSLWQEDGNNVKYSSGAVVIGDTAAPLDYQFVVDGKALMEGVTVKLSGEWPDYVFDKDYDLRSLNEIMEYIENNRHLPEIPSSKEVHQNGINLGKMNAQLLEKIEELTLYLIDQSIEMESLKERIGKLENEFKK